MRHTQTAEGRGASGQFGASDTGRNLHWMMLILWAVLSLPIVGWADQVDAPARPALSPGTEIRIEDPSTGGLGYWLLYLPPNYSADQHWPVLFNFHGLNQSPTLWPFDELTERRGFVIVGMEYLTRGLAGIDRAAEAENLRRVLALVSQWVSLDKQRLFIGGFSKGGWHASQLVERTSELWAGAVILGAGRSASPDASGMKNKLVFIGIGELDGEHQAAAAAADFYRRIGARVTFASFAGVAHSVDVDDVALKVWLADSAALQLPAETLSLLR